MFRFHCIGLTIFAILNLVGCSTVPTRYNEQSEGQWQAKALLRDKMAGESVVVNLDINAIQSKSMRVDVTAALGHPVAAMVLNGEKLTYALIEEKRYYSGPATAAAMKPVLNVPLEPSLVYNILFDLPVVEKNWTCTQDKKGFLEECKNLSNSMTLRWSERKGGRKTVFIDHPQASLQMNFMSFKPKVESTFVIAQPKGFITVR